MSPPVKRMLTGALAVVAIATASIGGYLAGHDRAVSTAQAAAAGTSARTAAFYQAKGATAADARQRGRADGLGSGRQAGHKAGRRAGARAGRRAAQRRATASQQADASTTAAAQSGDANPDVARAYHDTHGGTPLTNTPEGRKLAQQDPDCRANPPPPGYSGPLQC